MRVGDGGNGIFAPSPTSLPELWECVLLVLEELHRFPVKGTLAFEWMPQLTERGPLPAGSVHLSSPAISL